LGHTVDLRVEDDHLVIAPEHYPRQGWKAAFAAAGSSRQDPLLLAGSAYERIRRGGVGLVNFPRRDKIDQIRAVDRQRLVRKLGHAPARAAQVVSSTLVEMFTR
jgi:hypothetical protein